MTGWPQPSADNDYLAQHVAVLLRSFTRFTGRPLADPHLLLVEQARYLFFAPFVVVSHDAGSDPVFTYGNQAALQLFEMSWEEFTAMPSRQSAEPMHQAERERLLATVVRQGYCDGYQGIRIAKSGRRFLIQNVTVWNLIDERDACCGQAATYRDWTFLP